MSEVFVALAIAWAVITVIGHLSWVIVRSLFQLMTGTLDRPPVVPTPDEASDLKAARRVLLRLNQKGMISSAEADELRVKLRNLEYGQSTATIQPAATTAEKHRVPATAARAPEPESATEVPEMTDAADEGPWSKPLGELFERPIVAEIVDEPAAPSDIPTRPSPTEPATPPLSPTVLTSPRPAAVDEPEEVAPSGSTLSKAEIIQSFLAAHNIRWGELVAGMLIVVCSIGLVISLWSPLVETHRVIPSLIFLAANAAIFAAGLYTLSRWKLRHTSRAVLVIATLLVPLSVLAGLAAAGTTADVVQLNDPITLLALASGSAIYMALLYFSGKALSRKAYALPMVIAVAGPVAILPLAPAAVRALEMRAGWLLSAASIAVALASFMMIRARRADMTLGFAGGRARLLVMAFGGFSICVAVGYLAFMVRGAGLDAYLAIAIAAIPAIVALAGLARTIMKSARGATQSMIGATLYAVLIGIAWTTLPASLHSHGWLWAWAITLSASLLLIGWLANQPRQLALATIPIGISVVMTSPIWMGEFSWEQLAFWRRLLGGEPMVAMALVACAVAAFAAAVRSAERRQPLVIAAVGWVQWMLLTACILSVAPASLLGVVPSWVVTVVLAVAGMICAYYSMHWVACSVGAIAAVVFAWLSVLRPIGFGQPVGDSEVWMMTTMAIAVTLSILSEAIPRLAIWRGIATTSATESSKHWQFTSIAAVSIASLVACATAVGDWSTSAIYLAIASLMLFWSWTLLRDLNVLRGSQIATVALAVVVGYGRFEDWLFDPGAWTRCEAPWMWAILFGIVAGGWLTIRAAASFISTSYPELRNRIGELTTPAGAPRLMVDGPLSAIQTTLIVIGCVWALTSLYTRALATSAIQYEVAIWVPMVSLLLCGVVSWFGRQQDSEPIVGNYQLSVLGVATLLWASSTLAISLPIDGSYQVIVATSLIAICSAAGTWWLAKVASEATVPAGQIASSVATAVVAIASAGLLHVHWFNPIVDGNIAALGPTSAVSLWWLVAAAGLMWRSKSSHSDGQLGVSAVLAPLAVVILVPAIARTTWVECIQIAGLASIGWLLAARIHLGSKAAATFRPAIEGSSVFVILVGISSALLVTIGTLFELPVLRTISGIPCLLVSLSAIALWATNWMRIPRFDEIPSRLTWPMGLTLMSGQVAWIASNANLATGTQLVDVAAGVILIGSIASAVRYRVSSTQADFAHVGVAAFSLLIATFWIGNASSVLPWFCLASLTAAGLLAPIASSSLKPGLHELIAARALGWLAVVAGAAVILNRLTPAATIEMQGTITVLWVTVWVIAWRVLHVDRKQDDPDRRRHAVIALADMEFSGLLLAGLVLETFWLTIDGNHRLSLSAWTDPLMWTRVAAYVAAGASGLARGGRKAAWTIMLSSALVSASLVSVHVAVSLEASDTQRWIWALLPSGFAVALISHWIISLSSLIAKVAGGTARDHLAHVANSTWQLATLVSVLGAVSTIAMIASGAAAADAQLSTLTVALGAWAIAMTAECWNNRRLRDLAVAVGLGTVALLASIDTGITAEPMLSASMRWLVAAVLCIPMLIFGLPKLMGPSIADRWQPSLSSGAKASSAVAIGSLLCMLTLEAMLRENGRVAGVSTTLIIGVAMTLAALSALTAVIAIISGPNSRWRDTLSLTDMNRRVLVVAAQAIGAVTWLHVFLCNRDWAFVGIREYWPYVVMGLAFVSVGAVEWARRRKDEVMSGTLSYTALYLPLIPVIGFWLSGSGWQPDWIFRGSVVRYDVLLAVGAVYYLFVSAMWKQLMPRISAIVLANAAWWVVLAQRPGWEFLAHPQVWMIPPAVCVLVAAHLYRDRLAPKVTAAIRYAATLVIYISSTADMLIQQIGTSLSGPIILVVLALLGMLAGVVLRVRPFLYLGATFVFLGVTSMVWHANRAFDAVWPWWAFGITTGLCLLAGLMALEKNKPKLRRYADNLAAWNG